MSIVVSDTSPIRALAHLQSLSWLGDLFASVVVPPAVARELENPPSSMQIVVLSAWSFIAIQSPQSAQRVAELKLTLDLGEAEAIALAEQIGAQAVLIDESAGRAVAMNCGLTVVGTIGVLLRAKQLGLCPAIEPLLTRLQQELNFFISPALRQRVLQQANELSPPSLA
jgi:uncharacterized protein